MRSSLSFFPLSLSVCPQRHSPHPHPPPPPHTSHLPSSSASCPHLPDRTRRSDSLWFSSQCLNTGAINAGQRREAGEGGGRRGQNWILTGNSESEGDGSARVEAGREGKAGSDGGAKSDSRGFNINLRRVGSFITAADCLRLLRGRLVALSAPNRACTGDFNRSGVSLWVCLPPRSVC